VLPYVDEVCLVHDGKIIERGTYTELLAQGGEFAKLIDEFGTEERKMTQVERAAEGEAANEKGDKKPAGPAADGSNATKLVEGDERETGAVSWHAYVFYLRAAGGLRYAPILLALLGLAQLAQVASNVFLGFWTDLGIPGFSEGHYMGLYA